MDENPRQQVPPPGGRPNLTWLVITFAVGGLLFLACLIMFLLAVIY